MAPALAARGDEHAWRFQLTPYVWALSVDGTVSTGHAALRKASIDQSFGDILRNLNGAFFLQGSARRGRFVVLGDLSWSSSSDSGNVGSPLGKLRLKGRLRQFSTTVSAGYSIVQEPRGALDAAAGLRAWNVKATIKAPQLGIGENRTESWIDPVVALRGRLALAPDWSLIASGDIGGAGVGSRLTWQLTGSANYSVSESIFLSLGYRHLYLDYSSGGTRVRANYSGPVLGATFRF